MTMVHGSVFGANFLQLSSASFFASSVVRRPTLVPYPFAGEAAKAL